MRLFRLLRNRIRPSVSPIGDPTKSASLFGKVPPTADLSKPKTLVGAIFGKYLLATNVISSGVLMSIGDLMAQEVEYRNGVLAKRYDWTRNAKMFVVGAAQGPLHHYFYGWLDRAYLGATVKITTVKILFDQLLMSPVCIVVFFYSAGWLNQKNNNECTEEIQSKFMRVYITDWMVWPATQFINFYYLHPKYRVIYVNFITMLYNVFLSYVKHDDENTAAIEGTVEWTKKDE